MKKQLLTFLISAVMVPVLAQWQATNLTSLPYLPIGNMTVHKGDLYAVLVDLTPSKLYKLDVGGTSWTMVNTSVPGPRIIQDAGNKMYIATLNGLNCQLYYSYDGGQTLIIDTAGITRYQSGISLATNLQYHNGKILLGTDDAYFIKDTGDVQWRNITDMNSSALFPPSDPITWYGDTMYAYKNNFQKLFISADYGATWILRNTDLPADFRTTRIITDVSGSRLYVGGSYGNDSTSGIWYSDNGGSHWTLVNDNGLINKATDNTPQKIFAMYADGQTFYAAMNNNHSPSAPDVISTTTGLADLAWDTTGLPATADYQTYGDYFIRYNNDMYLALDVIDIYKKGAHASSIGDVGVQTLTLYPDPARDRLYIRQDAHVSEVTVVNLAGQKMMTSPYTPDGIDISGLAAGMYVVEVYTTDSFVPVRFIKE